jgi:hypothetical protein
MYGGCSLVELRTTDPCSLTLNWPAFFSVDALKSGGHSYSPSGKSTIGFA